MPAHDASGITAHNHRNAQEVLLIDQGGETILSKNSNELDFDIEARPRFSEGLIAFVDPKTRKYGFVDETGKSVIESKYSKAAPFSEGMARVAMVQGKQEKLGFINHSGQLVIPLRFNTDGDFTRNSTDFSDGLASLTENLNPTKTQEEKFAYIDKQGLVVLFTDFFWAGPFREGLAAVYDDESEKWGYINKSGKLAIPARYDLAEAFSEGLALVATLTAGR